jgi:hypothetical protein
MKQGNMRYTLLCQSPKHINSVQMQETYAIKALLNAPEVEIGLGK